jgi:phage gp45-like
MIRGIVKSVVEGVIKRFTASGRPDETISDREYLQHYGYTSRPLAGAEIIIIREGNHYLAIASDDRRYRISLKEGEVALYDDLGQKVHLTRDGIVVESPKRIYATAPEVTVTADEINLGGDRSVLLALVDERIIALLNAHTHVGVQPGNGATGAMQTPLTKPATCTTITKAV